MDDKQAFYVESTDGRKFKMVIRGDLGKLSVAKIRRYLKSYGVPDNQEILAGTLVLEDDMLGEHFGLRNEGVLHLRDPSQVAPPQPPSTAVKSLASQQPRPASSSSPLWGGGSSQQEGRGDYAAPLSTQGADTSSVSVLREQLRAMQRSLDDATARNGELEAQLAEAKKGGAVAAGGGSHGGAAPAGGATGGDGLANAKASLALVADRLHASLRFDANMTCVVGTDEDFSLLLTYDPATERLYLYSTLLTELPADSQVRMKLYEVLLEGSLLSREVCGGGIGVSTKNNVVVLTTSLPATHCAPSALCDVMPAFVETLGRWRDLVSELLA